MRKDTILKIQEVADGLFRREGYHTHWNNANEVYYIWDDSQLGVGYTHSGNSWLREGVVISQDDMTLKFMKMTKSGMEGEVTLSEGTATLDLIKAVIRSLTGKEI